MRRRSTRQLGATYDAVAASADHPTAEEVFERVRRELPRVSLATVYRNLDKLRDQGRVRLLALAGGVAHYDAMLHRHDHFVCESCGKVQDLEASRRSDAAAQLRRAGCVVRWQTTAVYGLCPACARLGVEGRAPTHG